MILVHDTFTWRVCMEPLRGLVFHFKNTPQVSTPRYILLKKIKKILRPQTLAMSKTKTNRRSVRQGRTGGKKVLGGVTKCKQCSMLVEFDSKCSFCSGVYHVGCMLSMRSGKKRVCTTCFEVRNMDPKDLDGHDEYPNSPTCPVAFHPFTKKYVSKRNLDVTAEAKVHA